METKYLIVLISILCFCNLHVPLMSATSPLAREIDYALTSFKEEQKKYEGIGESLSEKIFLDIEREKAYDERGFSIINRKIADYYIPIKQGDRAYYLNKNIAPQTTALVQELCDKLNMPLPLIILIDDSEFVNLGAYGLTHTISALLIGREVIRHMKPEVLQAGIAHELGHILYYHDIKNLMFKWGSRIALAVGLYATYEYVLKKKTEPSYSGQETKRKHRLSRKFEFPILAGEALIGYTLTQKIAGNLSRRFERHADKVARKTTKDPDAMRNFLKKLDVISDVTLLDDYLKARSALKDKIEREIEEPYQERLQKRLSTELYEDIPWWKRLQQRLTGPTHPAREDR